MKKLLLTLPLLTLPLTAMAQDKPTQAPNEVINEAAQTITKAICKDGVKGAASAVYECYQHTSYNNPDIEKCMIADASIFLALQKNKEKAQAMGEPVNNVPFFADDMVDKRIKKYFNQPHFKNYSQEERNQYLYNSQKAVKQQVVKLQKDNYCEKNNFSSSSP